VERSRWLPFLVLPRREPRGVTFALPELLPAVPDTWNLFTVPFLFRLPPRSPPSLKVALQAMVFNLTLPNSLNDSSTVLNVPVFGPYGRIF